MEVTADKLIKAFLKLRAQRKKLEEQFKAEDADLEAKQDMIQERLADLCEEIGVDSLKTPYGSATRAVKTRYWTQDWGSMYEFIKEHDALFLLEQRLHQTNLKTFLADNPDTLPMGLNSDSRYVINVRSK
jgi:hypothetical protein